MAHPYSDTEYTGVNLDTLMGALRHGSTGPGLQHKASATTCLAMAAALERARVVGVLDGWQRTGHRREAVLSSRKNGISTLTLAENSSAAYFEGPTPDAARAAAAAAIERGEV